MAKKKGKQTRVPGTDSNKPIKAVTKAAMRHIELKEEHSELTKELTKAKEILDGLMEKHELTFYEDVNEDIEVRVVEGSRSVKTKRRTHETAEAAE